MLLKSHTNEIETPTLTLSNDSVESPYLSRASTISCWTLLSLMGLVVLTRLVLGLIESDGGGDFFYYIVIAREWLRLPAGELPLSPSWMFYNPGIFRFYQALMLCGVTSSHGLSIAINSLNLINALLISVILWRMKVHPILSVWAGIWSLFIAEHYDGYGCNGETLVVLPMLLCLAIIANANQSWQQGRSILYLGVGLALSLYVKQQAALYIFGAFCALLWISNLRQIAWLKQARLLASVVAGVFLLLLAAEPGSLMETLLSKIRAVQSYPVQDASLWGSLGGNTAADPKLGYLLVQLAVVFFGLRFFKEGKRWLSTPAGALFALCVVMALASAWQVHTRPYRHYLLLTWPPLIVAVAIGIHAVLEKLSTTTLRRVAPWVLLLIVIFPFTKIGTHHGSWMMFKMIDVPVVDRVLESWGLVPRQAWFFPNPTAMPIIGAPIRINESVQPSVLDAMKLLREELPERSKVLIMPSGGNFIYWNLNLQHPLADYSFAKEDSIRVEALWSDKVETAILVTDAKKFRTEWIEQARAAGFVETRHEGPIILMRRKT